MKKLLLILLLLTPLAFAEDYTFEARKLHLSVRAEEFLGQADTVVSYAQQKGLTIDELLRLKEEFEAKHATVLDAVSKDDLREMEKEMRSIAKTFKEQARRSIGNVSTELKEQLLGVQHSESYFSKIKAIDGLRRKALAEAFSQRIIELRTSIEQENKEGKDSKIAKLLLAQFEREKNTLNETIFIKARNISITEIKETADTALAVTGRTVKSLKDIALEVLHDIDGEK
jgi:hypothetical protein